MESTFVLHAQSIIESFNNKTDYQEFQQQKSNSSSNEDTQYLHFLLRKRFPDFDERQRVWTAISNNYSTTLSEIYRGKSIISPSELPTGLLEEKESIYPKRNAA